MKKDFVASLNVIDKEKNLLNGYLNGNLMENIQDYDAAVSSMFYMTTTDLQTYCKENKLCSFTLDILMREKIVQINSMIEVTFREILNIPTYFQKGSAKIDYVCGDLLYYLYTDIGRNDVGNFKLCEKIRANLTKNCHKRFKDARKRIKLEKGLSFTRTGKGRSIIKI